jgi:hypothetical protein
VRQVFHRAEQLVAWFPDRGKLIVAQRWTGFSGGRQAFATSVNDTISIQRAGTPHSTTDSYNTLTAQMRPHAVTEERGRDHLAELGLPRERACLECSAVLPLGWLYCMVCGKPRGGHTTQSPADAFRVANVLPLTS